MAELEGGEGRMQCRKSLLRIAKAGHAPISSRGSPLGEHTCSSTSLGHLFPLLKKLIKPILKGIDSCEACNNIADKQST